MKKSVITLFLLALIAFGSDGQTIRRVNASPGVTGVNVYTNFNDAQNAASAGDIIYFEPTVAGVGVSHVNITITKTLTLIGTGYYLGQPNNTTPKNFVDGEITLNTVTIEKTAPNTKIEGITLVNGTTINAVNTEIKRCFVSGVQYNRTASGNNGSNGKIIQSTLIGSSSKIVGFGYEASNTVGGVCTTTPFQIENIEIRNNISKSSLTIESINTTGYLNSGICSSPAQVGHFSNMIIANNTVGDKQSSSSLSIWRCENCTAHSNILSQFTTFPSNSVAVSKNVCDLACNAGANNLDNVDWTTLFSSGAIQNIDKDLILSSTSPAIGAGLAGVDAGAFGGVNPYKLSGIPAFPILTNYTLSGVGNSSTPLNVSVTVRGNN